VPEDRIAVKRCHQHRCRHRNEQPTRDFRKWVTRPDNAPATETVAPLSVKSESRWDGMVGGNEHRGEWLNVRFMGGMENAHCTGRPC